MGSRVNIDKPFPSSSLSSVSSLILFPLFVTSLVRTGSYFVAGVIVTGFNLTLVLLTMKANLPQLSLKAVANLPPVSTIQSIPVAKFEMTLMLFQGLRGR